MKRVFEHSRFSSREPIDPHPLQREASHAPAQKGGEAGADPGRKQANRSHGLPSTDANGFILATTGMMAGNPNHAVELKDTLRAAFTLIKRLGISIVGSDFNPDSAFDPKAAGWTCVNPKVSPNLVENTRSRKKTKPGPKRLFNPEVYKLRLSSERTFAWIDQFRARLVRFDRKAAHFMGAHYLVYALINRRHQLAEEKSQ